MVLENSLTSKLHKKTWLLSILILSSVHFSSVALSCLTLCDPMTAARQASLSITNSRSLLKLMSIESVMPSSHLILCHPLLLLPSIFPVIRVFSYEVALCIRWQIASILCACMLSHVQLCNPMDGIWPGSFVPGILQARILEWVAILPYRGSYQPRDQSWVSCISCIGRWLLYHWATREAHFNLLFISHVHSLHLHKQNKKELSIYSKKVV